MYSVFISAATCLLYLAKNLKPSQYATKVPCCTWRLDLMRAERGVRVVHDMAWWNALLGGASYGGTR